MQSQLEVVYMRLFTSTTAVLLLFTAAAAAQVPSTSTGIATIVTSCDATAALSRLTLSYNSGSWDQLQKDGRSLMDALQGKQEGELSACTEATAQPTNRRREVEAPGTSTLREARGLVAEAAEAKKAKAFQEQTQAATAALGDRLDYRKHWIALEWIGTDSLGSTQLLRAIIHSPAGEEYSSDLPGVDSDALVEVFLANSSRARAVSLYTSTREKDEFVEQLPAFLQAVFNPVAGLVGVLLPQVQAVERVGKAEEPKVLIVLVKQASLPLRRAKVRLQLKAKDAATVDDFKQAIAEAAAAVRFSAVPNSTSARKQVDYLEENLAATAAAACIPGSAPDTCVDALDRDLQNAYNDAVKGASKDDIKAADAVDKQFRSVVLDSLSTKAELDLTFRNKPLTHFALGAGTAVITHAKLSRPRAQLDDKTGNLTGDPLGRVLTAAFVNISPKGYNPDAARVRPAERFRGFFGAALTPDFGVVAGGNVLIVRGVGVFGGWGYLFGKGADEGELNKPPADTKDPFKLSKSPNTWFIGLSYNYK